MSDDADRIMDLLIERAPTERLRRWHDQISEKLGRSTFRVLSNEAVPEGQVLLSYPDGRVDRILNIGDGEDCPKCGNPGLEYATKAGRIIYYCGAPCGTLFKDGKIEKDDD